MEFIRATNADIEFSERLIISNMSRYFNQYSINWDHQRFIQNWTSWQSYILRHNNQAVGIVCLSFFPEHVYINDLQIKPQFLGQGIGSWAMSQVEVLALERAVNKIRLRGYHANPAKNWYLQLGFSVAMTENQTSGREKLLTN